MMSNNASSRTDRLIDQVAIVTGGGRGLGRAFAQALAKAGCLVAITARTEAELNETERLISESGGTALPFIADVTDQHAMEQVVAQVEEQLGEVDILVNNAAVLTPLGLDWEVDAEAWWHTMEINVRGPFLCTQMVLPGMIARSKGRIINVTSGAAHESAPNLFPYGTAYCTSKTALSRMTNLLAQAVKEHGITAFAFAPGGPSAMVEILATSPNVPEEINAHFRNALEESHQTEMSVQMLLFLLSGQADQLTGRHISHTDSIDDLLQRTDEILRDDLFTLGLRL